MGDRRFAIDLYNQGVKASQDKSDPKNVPHAYQCFASACMVDPTWYQAFYQCGNNNNDLQLHHSAIACWRRALECETVPAERARILCNLGWRLHTIGKTQEAYEVSCEAVRLDPTLAGAWLNLSLIHGMFDQQPTAVECARRSFELRPDDSEAQMALAFALLFNREFEEGFKHFEARFAYKLKEYLQYPYPKWDGEEGKVVYLSADQGLGDTLSFTRFVEMTCARSQYVHARIQPELMRLFSHAFLHIKNLNLIPTPYPFPQADCWTTFVSLPSALRLTNEQIRNTPQIPAGDWAIPLNVNFWKVPDRKLHVGIAWAGSPLNDIDRHRNIPIQFFLELQRVPGVQLYSLQIGERGRDMHDAGCAPLIRDITPGIRDVADTVAFLRELDMVITVESALGHICALAGRECWVPYSHLGRDYRIGIDSKDMIWTPHHRIFRQGDIMTWGPAFQEIEQALREKVGA